MTLLRVTMNVFFLVALSLSAEASGNLGSSTKLSGLENEGDNIRRDLAKSMGSRNAKETSSSEAIGIYSLEKCETGCLNDVHCKSGLVCQLRSGGESVHGCTTVAAQDGLNMCVVPEEGVLVHVGNNAQVPAFSLEKCQGDCDTDADCAYGLVCFERSWDEAVPGCDLGGTGIEMEDYCTEPQDEKQLILFGINGVPEENYPLKACQGDCGTDADCEGLLKCYQRDDNNPNDPIPGCEGLGVSTWDYCYDDGSTHEPSNVPSSSPTVAPTPEHSESPSAEPTASPSVAPTYTPTEAPSGVPTATRSESPTAAPTTPPTELVLGDLQACAIGCTNHHDCADGLNCLIRNKAEKVPGCKIGGKRGKNMCYKPPQNELVFVGDDGDTSDKISKRMANRELPNFPLQECQGDCDSDWDCEWGLKCMKKVGDGVPGCTIPPSGPTPKEGYCYKPNKGSRVARLSGKKKLKWCEGHCLNDDHCSGSLVCFYRDAKRGNAKAKVVGCSGSVMKSTNYCVSPKQLKKLDFGNKKRVA